MPLPETIPVRYTEEEAGYVTIRPVVRQTFRLNELLDMILSVAGKDVARIRQLLHSGTVVYHFFRYSWAGFDVNETELAAALAKFPDADPSRPFFPLICAPMPCLTRPAQIPRHLLESGPARPLPSGGFFADKVSGSAWSSLPPKRIPPTKNTPTDATRIFIVWIWTRKSWREWKTLRIGWLPESCAPHCAF